jgi:hypothetical protein
MSKFRCFALEGLFFGLFLVTWLAETLKVLFGAEKSGYIFIP